ncbi:hypothetical protein OQH60_07955, partial [Campylobacter sp. MIT 21-1685]
MFLYKNCVFATAFTRLLFFLFLVSSPLKAELTGYSCEKFNANGYSIPVSNCTVHDPNGVFSYGQASQPYIALNSINSLTITTRIYDAIVAQGNQVFPLPVNQMGLINVMKNTTLNLSIGPQANIGYSKNSNQQNRGAKTSIKNIGGNLFIANSGQIQGFIDNTNNNSILRIENEGTIQGGIKNTQTINELIQKSNSTLYVDGEVNKKGKIGKIVVKDNKAVNLENTELTLQGNSIFESGSTLTSSKNVDIDSTDTNSKLTNKGNIRTTLNNINKIGSVDNSGSLQSFINANNANVNSFSNSGRVALNNFGTIDSLSNSNAMIYSGRNGKILDTLTNSKNLTLSSSLNFEGNKFENQQQGVISSNNSSDGVIIKKAQNVTNSGNIKTKLDILGSSSIKSFNNTGNIEGIVKNQGNIQSFSNSKGNLQNILNDGTINSLNNLGTINTLVNNNQKTIEKFYNNKDINTFENKGTINTLNNSGAFKSTLTNKGTISTFSNTGKIEGNFINDTGRTIKNFSNNANGNISGIFENKGIINTFENSQNNTINKLTNSGNINKLIQKGTINSFVNRDKGQIDLFQNSGTIQLLRNTPNAKKLNLTNTNIIENFENLGTAVLNNQGNISNFKNLNLAVISSRAVLT